MVVPKVVMKMVVQITQLKIIFLWDCDSGVYVEFDFIYERAYTICDWTVIGVKLSEGEDQRPNFEGVRIWSFSWVQLEIEVWWHLAWTYRCIGSYWTKISDH